MQTYSMTKLHKHWLLVVLLGVWSAAMLALAIPNELFLWGNPLFGLICLIPLYLSMRFTANYRTAFLTGLLFGGLAHGLSSFWLWFFKGFAFWTLGTTTITYMVVYGFLGWYLFGALRHGGKYRPLLFAMIWAVFEYAKSIGFLGYPWGLLPYSWNTVLPFNQAVELFGLYILSFILALANSSIAELLVPLCSSTIHESFKSAAVFFAKPKHLVAKMLLEDFDRNIERLGWVSVATVLIGLMFGYGFLRLEWKQKPEKTISLVLVQHNTDNWVENDGGVKTLETCVQLANQELHAKPDADMLVFSETSLVRPWKESAAYYMRSPREYPLISLLKDYNMYLFTGAPIILDWESFRATNSVLLINPEGTLVEDYAKMHPVPFAESIPFWDVPAFRHFIQNVVGLSSGWEMGTRHTIFKLPLRNGGEVRFAAPICFEDAFSDVNRVFVRKGVDFLLNLTNDSWSKRVSAEIQHFVAARYRTMEYRVPLVRSTNGGVTAVVDIDGSIQTMFPVFTQMAGRVSVPIYKRTITSYALLGDWIVFVFALCLAFSIFIVRRFA